MLCQASPLRQSVLSYKAMISSTTAAVLIGLGRMGMVSSLSWSLQGQLVPDSDPNFTPDYGFGLEVAINGGTAVVGSFQSGQVCESPVDDEWFGDGLGSARVFVRSTSGNDWVQEDILIANDGKNGQYYGYSVSIHDDTALVGAFSIPDYMANAFVFVRNAGEWTQQEMLLIDENITEDGQMPSVAINLNTAVVGLCQTQTDPAEVLKSNSLKGKVLVFERKANVWGPPIVIQASDGIDYDCFGGSVSISSDSNSILVGAIGADDLKGKGYVFVRNGTGWIEQAVLFPPTQIQHGLGASVAIDGNVAVLGVMSATGEPTLYVRNANNTWSYQTRLRSQGTCYGCSVDLKNGTLLIGSSIDGMIGAYIYSQPTPGMWTLQATLKTSAAGIFMNKRNVAFDPEDMTVDISDVNVTGVGIGSAFVFDAPSSLSRPLCDECSCGINPCMHKVYFMVLILLYLGGVHW